MTVSMHRTQAVLRLSKKVPVLLVQARAILTAMGGNPSFPSPKPPLADVATAIAELDEAQTAAQSRTRGTVATRNEKQVVLLARLELLRAYVEGVANENPETAPSTIEGAGMSVKRPSVQNKLPFTVKHGRVSGSVLLLVRSAGDRATYRWQWSTDGGVTWHDAPATRKARTEIEGLPVGETCWFRVKVVTKDGEQGWSEPVSFLVG